MDEINIRLRKAMVLRNITPKELSDKTGIPKSSISQYMSGYAKPRQDRIFLISKALNIREEWLLGYDVEMERCENSIKHNDHESNYHRITSDSYEYSLLSEVSKLNQKGRRKLLDTAREMTCNPLYNPNYQIEVAAAHERTDIEVTEEMRQHDDALMDDDNNWE